MRVDEYIICAAIHWDNEHTYQNQPKNITKGLVVCGRRHHNCFTILALMTFERAYLNNHIQGFVTSKDRFVDRKEAYKIAIAANQIEPRKEDSELDEFFNLKEKDSRILTSEDLY